MTFELCAIWGKMWLKKERVKTGMKKTGKGPEAEAKISSVSL